MVPHTHEHTTLLTHTTTSSDAPPPQNTKATNTTTKQEDMAWLGQAFADALEVPACVLDTVGAATPEALLAAQNKVGG